MNILYEILVPTMFGYPEVKPIRTKHHKEWDKYVQKITGGLTILSPGKGKWINKGVEYPEKVIPVRVMCVESTRRISFDSSVTTTDKSQIEKIIQFTLKHYRQKAVMYYVLSNDVNIVYSELTKYGE